MKAVLAILSALIVAQAANLRGLQAFVPIPSSVQDWCAMGNNMAEDGCVSWYAMAAMVQNDCDSECQFLVQKFAMLDISNRRARRMAMSTQFNNWIQAAMTLPFSVGPTIDAITSYRPYGAMVGVTDSTNPKKYCLDSFVDYWQDVVMFTESLPSAPSPMRRLNEEATLEALKANLRAAAMDIPDVNFEEGMEEAEMEDGARRLGHMPKTNIVRSLRNFCPGCKDQANTLVTPVFPSWIPMAQNFYCSKTTSPTNSPRDYCLVGLRAALLDIEFEGAAPAAFCRPGCADGMLMFLVATGRMPQFQADLMLAMLPQFCSGGPMP